MNKNGIHFCNVYKSSSYSEYIHRPKNKPLHYETDSILYCIWNNTAETSSKWSPHPRVIRYAKAGCSKWWLTFAQRTNKANLIFTLCNKYFLQLLFCAAGVQAVLQQITQLETKKILLLIGHIDFSQSVHWFSQRRGERWKFMSLVWDFFPSLMRGILGEVLCGKSHLRPNSHHLRTDSLNCSPLYPLLLSQAESYIQLFAI